ncbi:tryptophan synthase subunit alpha [Arthrobacter sp. H5]|uniref:tryptophan synthase subunit alpha n=1 Tax=Arthrobacter sp. H5 TaxID=1267973 RepID=UPI00048903C0|nr:tryptophan synthase subunit alpha [Arthrobacter sp. H5]
MSRFFAGSSAANPGLALFLNAGDPPLDQLHDLMLMLDRNGVDCLELAVPFANSATDGPVVQRSALRALEQGVDLPAVLAFLARVRPQLTHLKVALLVDWSHSIKGTPLDSFVASVADCAADGVLVHGLPPILRAEYHVSAQRRGVPVVTTCYHGASSAEVIAHAAANASAYVYLVARYGRTGSAPATGYADLAATVTQLTAHGQAPVAVGFGIKTREDILAVGRTGAHAAIIGSAAVSCIENTHQSGPDTVRAFEDFIHSVMPTTLQRTTQ